MNTNNIGNPPLNLDPPSPISLNNPITAHLRLLTHHTKIILLLTLLHHQILLLVNPLFRNFQTRPPRPTSFPNVITTQPQAHSTQTYLPTTRPANANRTSSFPIFQNPSSTLPYSMHPSSTFYDPYASLHPGFHYYHLSSFQHPSNPFPPSKSPILLTHLLTLLRPFFQ